MDFVNNTNKILTKEGVFVTLSKKTILNHDSYDLEFMFEDNKSVLGIEVGQYIFIQYNIYN